MTKRLEVELKRDGCEVSGKVLHQDESLTNTSAKDDEYRLICKFGSYEIRSWNVPEVDADKFILYIRGNASGYDNVCDDFCKEQEAQDYIDAMNKMVDYINSDDFEMGKDITDIELTKQSLLKNSDAEYDDKKYEPTEFIEVFKKEDKFEFLTGATNAFLSNGFREDGTKWENEDIEYNKTEHIINELFYTIRDNDVDDEIKDWCKDMIDKLM